jgi:hypothetical protein
MVSGAAEPPVWESADTQTFDAPAAPWVRARYAEMRDLVPG